VEEVRATNDQWRVAEAVKIASAILIMATSTLAQRVVRSEEVPCSEEIVRPNFALKDKVHVSGELKDPTGAPFAESRVVLKVADNRGRFTLHRTVATDKEGGFDLGMVEAGNYRLLSAPSRAFKQPLKVVCAEGHDCKINLVVDINPTDQPFTGCPIQ
jgi:hypothetical protein